MAVFIGVDVGTGSARAAVVDAAGTILATHVCEIRMHSPVTDHHEQSSDDIWDAVCRSVSAALALSRVDPNTVAGLGFDATCSLVVLDGDRRPVTVSTTGDDTWNVVVWMDHRAVAEARDINATHHDVLKYVGGVISPEMETPKLLWLKRHLPASWSRARFTMDLADFLVMKATGVDDRSLCTTVCKWTYVPSRAREHGGDSAAGWDPSYFDTIGLDGLARSEAIGQRVVGIGAAVGQGLTAAAARDLARGAAAAQLRVGTAVSTGLIDAHAGGLGMLGASRAIGKELRAGVAVICGTSSCHMAVSAGPVFVPGVWGPYESAMIPDLWLAEGGQSATGALLDHTVAAHPAGRELLAAAAAQDVSVYSLLNARVDALAEEQGSGPLAQRLARARLAADTHVLPDHHGNRSPRADPTLRGAVMGLTLDATPDSLAILYVATVQALAHGTRHIIDAMNECRAAAGEPAIDVLFLAGGLSKNRLFVETHADVCSRPVVLPREPDAVLVGAAVTGAVAAGTYRTVADAMAAMNHAGEVVPPAGAVRLSNCSYSTVSASHAAKQDADGLPDAERDAAAALRRFHDAKHTVFLALHDMHMTCRQTMSAQ